MGVRSRRDALIADAVEEHTSIRGSSAPLIFQGGNCLVGDDFWLLGKDYFADTVELLGRQRPPVSVPEGDDPQDVAVTLFGQYVDAGRRLTLVGTRRAIPARALRGTREGDTYLLDLAMDGAGTFQPIFHIDMFITLIGRDAGGAFQILVGSPAMGDELLGTTSPFALAEVYDTIADDLRRRRVRRCIETRWCTGRLSGRRSTCRSCASRRRPTRCSSRPSTSWSRRGPPTTTSVRVRSWHHITWNNCLVENSTSVGRHVYLPTYGHGARSGLSVIDEAMRALWEQLGFTTHMLGDFNGFAERQGVVHCIKKYIERGD